MTATAVRIGGVVISPTFVDEISSDGDSVLRIRREDIQSLGIGYGFVAERMILLLVIGIAMIVAGPVWLYAVGVATVQGLVALPKTAAAGGFVALAGFFCVRMALRRGVYLTVKTHREVRTLVVGGVDLDAAQKALVEHAHKLGYTVDV